MQNHKSPGWGWILACCLWATSCGGGDVVTTAELQDVLTAEWQAYSSDRRNFGGGLAMQILSPAGDHFISTGMGPAMSSGHRFRTASVTKTFTAAGIMLLQQRGQLNIDDRITDSIPGKDMPYVPATAGYDIPHKSAMTIRMVLMHRAGVFDLSNQNIAENDASRGKPYVNANYIAYREGLDRNHQFTFDELFQVIAANRQQGFDAPGSQYKYSDTGYCLLAVIIERVSGKSYGRFISDEFLVPNGLASTTLPWQGTDQSLPVPYTSGYVWTNETLTDVTASNMSPFVGNGNIVTTPLDLATWCKRLFTGRTGLSLSTVDRMKIGLPRGPGSSSTYGLGIIYDPQLGFGHGGAHAGYLTHMYYRPDTDTAFVIMTNVWNCASCSVNNASIEEQFAMMTDTANKVIARMGLR